MRQASWNEMFAPKRGSIVLEPEVPQEPRGWRRFFWWEDILSFLLLSAVLFAVVDSVYRAEWVESMPSLYPVTFFGLLMGAVLARVRWPEVVIHVLALPIGAAAALGTILSILPGATPWARYEELHDRMAAWFHIAFNGGISNDELPFIVLVVPLAWLAAYLSAWAVFRWQNAWLALIPAGFLLLSNVSYLPGQFTFAVLVFLVAGALLLTRLHLTSRSKQWREEETPYPPLLSLSVLHTTLWLIIGVMLIAWMMPQAGEAGPLESAWQDATEPIVERTAGVSRLFVSVRGPRESLVHRYEDILPFQGGIELPDTLVLDVITDPLDQRRYLRARSFDTYTSTGWQEGVRHETELSPDDTTRVDEGLAARIEISTSLTSEGRTGETAFTVGQPRQADAPTIASWLSGLDNVTSLTLPERLRKGATVQTTGSISMATVEELRAACHHPVQPFADITSGDVIHFSSPVSGHPRTCEDVPAAIQTTYIDLPLDIPNRVARLAWEITEDDTNSYDAATSIEDYLRDFPIDYDIPGTPRDRDAVDYFLFDLQRGYFDYHASAMVVMLRSIGVPSRLAVGYVLQPEERDPNTNRYRVTEQSAFAWPEVYFPGYGWVEFNPTPSQPRVQRVEPVTTTADEDDEAGDVPNTLGLEDLPGQIGAEGDAGALPLETGSSSNRNLWIAFAVLGGLAAIAAFGGGWGRYLWVRGLSGAPEATRRWEQTVRLASWSGHAPDPAQTPHEYAAGLRARIDGVDSVEVLADRYVDEQFGRGGATGEDPTFVSAWQTVRSRLLRKLLRLRKR